MWVSQNVIFHKKVTNFTVNNLYFSQNTENRLNTIFIFIDPISRSSQLYILIILKIKMDILEGYSYKKYTSVVMDYFWSLILPTAG